MIRLTTEEIEAIRDRTLLATDGPWDADIYTIYCETGGHIAEVVDDNQFANMHFIANAREDIPKLLAEVERLREAIDNAASLLPDGENRLANRFLCVALGVDENKYGFYGEDDD